jgi:ABC-type amino acid transport substrate-binding protein
MVTRPYYRSGYVFVSRAARKLDLHSLDDPRLGHLRIGIQNLGDSDRSLPPVQALASRGIVGNLVSYNIFGNLDETNPASAPIRAVERGEVDVAVAWGPIAGYFARNSKVPLTVNAIDSDPKNPVLPLAFDIGIGLRTDENDLKYRLGAELEKRRTEINNLLRSYGIPLEAAEGER